MRFYAIVIVCVILTASGVVFLRNTFIEWNPLSSEQPVVNDSQPEVVEAPKPVPPSPPPSSDAPPESEDQAETKPAPKPSVPDEKQGKKKPKPAPKPATDEDQASPSPNDEIDLVKLFTHEVWRPYAINAPVYKPYNAFEIAMPKGKKRFWNKRLGEDLCIIDMDNRPWHEPGQIWSDHMTWSQTDQVHGQSLGVLQHWVYAKIHGYKYYFVEFEEPTDRRSSWMKPPIIAKLLPRHKTCVYLDSDAIFSHLDLPLEWMMNFWSLDPKESHLTLAADPSFNREGEPLKTRKGDHWLNTGFIISQNTSTSQKIFQDWWDCPTDEKRYPGCHKFAFPGPGITDQGGFGSFVRYDHYDEIKELPCTEANGYPESGGDCHGKFVKHIWTGKDDWLNIAVGEQIPGVWLGILHAQFLKEKKDFYLKQKDLPG